MRLTRTEPRWRNLKRVEPVILFGVGNHTFAIPASSVEEIRNLDGLVPHSVDSPFSNLRKVKFSFERNKKICFVIDCNLHFRMQASCPTRILVLRDLPIGLLVDRIDRMCELPAVRKLPQAFTGEERTWYRGLAVVKDEPVPVVNPLAFLSKAEIAIAQADAGRIRASSEPGNSLAQGAAPA